MRPVTRNFLLGMGVVFALLLALGAVPGYLKSGDPYYLTATPIDGSDGTADATAATDANRTAVEAANLSTQRYPYTTEALDDAAANGTGQSSPYWRGPVGVKGAFTHSPFDEYDSLVQQFPDAVEGDGVRVRHEGALYRVSVTQQP